MRSSTPRLHSLDSDHWQPRKEPRWEKRSCSPSDSFDEYPSKYSQEGSIEEANWRQAKWCLEENDCELYDINRRLVDIRGKNRDPDKHDTRPLLHIMEESIPSQFKMS